MKTRLPLLVLALLFVASARAQDRKLTRAEYFRFADAIFVAKFDTVSKMSISYTLPPGHHCEMRLTLTDAVRGPFKMGVTLDLPRTVVQIDAPTYPVGKDCVVALEFHQGTNTWNVIFIEEANKENVKEAKAAKKFR